MGRSTVCSSIAIATVVGILCTAPSALASLANGEAEAPRATALRIYGAYLPDRLEWDETHWGFGIAARSLLNPRWGIDVGAARFVSSDRALTPMTIGLAYGPEARKGPRPWVEFGVGLYRLESTISRIVVIPTIPSDPYYNTERTRPHETRRNNAGGYLGVGFDLPLSERIGLGTGVRIHGWSYPDALIALQSGLSFAF